MLCKKTNLSYYFSLNTQHYQINVCISCTLYICNPVLAHLQEIKALHEVKVQTAKERNELLTCGCCFEDECLFEDMAPCEDGHLFCKECICRSVESAVGEGRTKFQCLTGKIYAGWFFLFMRKIPIIYNV